MTKVSLFLSIMTMKITIILFWCYVMYYVNKECVNYCKRIIKNIRSSFPTINCETAEKLLKHNKTTFLLFAIFWFVVFVILSIWAGVTIITF
jgi:hypothetical protein